MADNVEQSVSVVAVTAAVGAVVLLIVLLCSFTRKADEPEEEEKETKGDQTENWQGKKKTSQNKKQRPVERKERVAFSHEWLCGSLKSHSSPVLDIDFSANGKYLASCAEDRTVLLWNVKDFDKKEHKNIRTNVDLDHATNVRFSPDNKAFIVSLFFANAVRIFKMGKKEDGSMGNIQAAFDFPKAHDHEIINIGIASSGRFIMTCSRNTTIKVWDLKGELLANVVTNQVETSHAAVSPCGRFIASSGFTPDVKVWEVCFEKSGSYRDVTRAFELKGHTAGIYHFAFSGDSTRMVTASKDGTWRVWDTNIEYSKGQEPYLLHTGHFEADQPARVAMSHDGRTVALVQGRTLHIFSALTARLEQTIENIHTSPISCVVFDTSDRYLATAGDRHIHVFHNIVGHRATLTDLEQRYKSAANASMKERIKKQIEEARNSLAEIDRSEKTRNGSSK